MENQKELACVLSESYAILPFCSAVLGIADDGVPIVASFLSPRTPHIMITASPERKRVLLLGIVFSMAFITPPGLLRLVLVGDTFRDCTLPHLARLAIAEREAVGAITDAARLARLFRRNGNDFWAVVVVDEIAPLLKEEGVAAALSSIAAEKHGGVHLVVASTQNITLPGVPALITEERGGVFRARLVQGKPEEHWFCPIPILSAASLLNDVRRHWKEQGLAIRGRV